MLPFALGLLALGGLGQNVAWGMRDARDERLRQGFKADAEAMQAGLDLSTEEGARQLALRQITDPRMIQFGNQQLGQALERAQQNKQWQWGNENLTKQQQENLTLAKASQAQQEWEGQQRIGQGWANVDINKQQLGLQQQAAQQQQAQDALRIEGLGLDNETKRAALANVGLPDPAELAKRSDTFRGERQKALTDWNAITGQYNQTMGVLENPNPSPTDLQAAVVGLAKVFDPTSVVSGAEGEGIKAGATGGAGQLAQLLQQYTKGGMTPELRRNFASTMEAAVNQRFEGANAAQAYIRRNAESDPVVMGADGKPRINLEAIFPALENPTAKWNKKTKTNELSPGFSRVK
jgi:hypothetical protein